MTLREPAADVDGSFPHQVEAAGRVRREDLEAQHQADLHAKATRLLTPVVDPSPSPLHSQAKQRESRGLPAEPPSSQHPPPSESLPGGMPEPQAGQSLLIEQASRRAAHREASCVYSSQGAASLCQDREDVIARAVFRDLWGKGYWITPGDKFGGRFLVYPGDPSRFHATMIVHLEAGEGHAGRKAGPRDLTGLEVVGLVRLATAVRKTVVLASFTACSTEDWRDGSANSTTAAAGKVQYRVIEFAGVTQRGWGAAGEHQQEAKPNAMQAAQGGNSDAGGGEASKKQRKSRRKRPRGGATEGTVGRGGAGWG